MAYDNEKKINFVPSTWTVQAEKDFSQCSNVKQLEFLEKEVLEGRQHLWAVSDENEKHLGSILTYVEKMNDGLTDMVIGATGGEWMRTIKGASRILLELAYQYKADRCRVSVTRPGIIRTLEAFDFHVHETVLYKKIPVRGGVAYV